MDGKRTRERGRRSLDTAARRLVRAGVRAGIGNSRYFGPPRRHTTLAEAAAEAGAPFRVVEPGYDADWTGISYDSGEPVSFLAPLPGRFPDAGLLELERGRVIDGRGWPVTHGDALIDDATFMPDIPRFHSYQQIVRLKRARRLSGRVLSLGSTFAENNYGHTLLDAYGRLSLLRSAGEDLASFDAVLVPRFRSREITRLWSKAGIDPTQIVPLEPGDHFEAERLLVTSFPGLPRVYPTWVPGFFQSLIPTPSTGGRRLFVIRRSDRRSLLNSPDIEALVAGRGFELYDPGNPDNLPEEDFASAGFVMGAHGAALADLAFCRPGTQVVELLPEGHSHPYFATLSVSGGLDYTAVPGASVSSTRQADWTVEVTRIERLLDRLD